MTEFITLLFIALVLVVLFDPRAAAGIGYKLVAHSYGLRRLYPALRRAVATYKGSDEYQTVGNGSTIQLTGIFEPGPAVQQFQEMVKDLEAKRQREEAIDQYSRI